MMPTRLVKIENEKLRAWDETSEDATSFQHKSPTANYMWEIRLTQLFLAFTFVAWLIVSWQTGEILWDHIQTHNVWLSLEQAAFILIIQGLIYGNFVYQLTRIGYLRRRLAHEPATPEERESLYDHQAPTLAILVPSYKEELNTVRRTLLSAALQDYPSKRVVLLVDDPAYPNNLWDQKALEEVRALPSQLQAIFDKAAAPFHRAQTDFISRSERGEVNLSGEAKTLSKLYEAAAHWLESFAKTCPLIDHADQLLLDRVFKRAAIAHGERARQLRSGSMLTLGRIQREYKRLAASFTVEFTSFERKRYVNMSHESNKAMNLNSYIRLLGRSWSVVPRDDGDYLEETTTGKGTFHVPAADFLITLDADSLLVPEYALVLVHEMLRKGNERLAVAQTPYNTIPNPQGHLERIAGATTDIQYLIHQGFTHYDATYWVGANALLRTAALSDIKTTVQERGFEMPVFIQDRTVIEDTESSIDLVACGWKLYNYPERLAYSATPPDFGSLLIQRRRWANGGLIILPKLLRYLVSRPWNVAKLKEGFFRIHYLSSIAAVNIGLLILFTHSFEHSIDSVWLPLTALPYFILYARDLRYNGFHMRDLLSVYALNLLLLPVNLGGVLKSLHQGIAGHKIPFGRTPKISGRTSTPALYCLAELALPLFCIGAAAWDAWQGRWAHGMFALINGLLFVYGLFRLIGMKELLQDLVSGVKLRKVASRPAPSPLLHSEPVSQPYQYKETPKKTRVA